MCREETIEEQGKSNNEDVIHPEYYPFDNRYFPEKTNKKCGELMPQKCEQASHAFDVDDFKTRF